MNESACDIVRLGLLHWAQPGQILTGRGSNPKPFIIDSRGAGTNLPLRCAIITELHSRLARLEQVDLVVGIATSGIMWGSWLAWDRQLPYATARLDGPRESGLRRQLEGHVAGRRAVLVDNWLRTGYTIDAAADLVAQQGGVVVGAIVIAAADGVTCRTAVAPLWLEADLVDAAVALGLLHAPQDQKGVNQ